MYEDSYIYIYISTVLNHHDKNRIATKIYQISEINAILFTHFKVLKVWLFPAYMMCLPYINAANDDHLRCQWIRLMVNP